MYEELKSCTVHTPKTLAEYADIIRRAPDAINWAGGTYLMERPDFYPNQENQDIIDLNGIPELQRITRTDRFVEVGAMVNAAQLADAGRLVLPRILLEALSSMGSTIIARQVTIGGALCVPDTRLAISTALSVLDAIAEIKWYQKNGKTVTRWIPVSRLYDKDGKLTNSEFRMLLTKVRIALECGDYQKFMLSGEPARSPSEAVIIAFQANRNSGSLGKVQMCIAFPRLSFFNSKEIVGQLSGLALPISPATITLVAGNLSREIQKNTPNIGELPLERALRMFESILHDLNALYYQS